MYSQTQFVRKFFNSNYVILASLTPLFYIFILYILLLLCFIFILMQKKKIVTFSLIMTEVRSRRRVFLPLVFTSNTFKSMESMVFDYK